MYDRMIQYDIRAGASTDRLVSADSLERERSRRNIPVGT
jgi:hypothetical protein